MSFTSDNLVGNRLGPNKTQLTQEIVQKKSLWWWWWSSSSSVVVLENPILLSNTKGNGSPFPYPSLCVIAPSSWSVRQLSNPVQSRCYFRLSGCCKSSSPFPSSLGGGEDLSLPGWEHLVTIYFDSIPFESTLAVWKFYLNRKKKKSGDVFFLLELQPEMHYLDALLSLHPHRWWRRRRFSALLISPMIKRTENETRGKRKLNKRRRV